MNRSTVSAFVCGLLVCSSLVTAQETRFRVRIENISGETSLPGPLAPGAYAVHDEAGVLFVEDTSDSTGLEALAEDGNPGPVAESLAADDRVVSSGTFLIPSGGDGPAPLFPGSAYVFEVEADPSAPNLSFATMLVRTNDLFLGPDAAGLALFDENGMPISGDVTSLMELWDAGSEFNEAPGMGPNQAPLQAGPNTGAREGVVSAFASGTRALPLAQGIVRTLVSVDSNMMTLTVINDSAELGSLSTPVAPLFVVTHNSDWNLFETGQDASAGLEVLAEDGAPTGLVGEHQGAAGTGFVGAMPITEERPEADPGPA
ncbi:MAG: spondin domain-containing protein, partial [Planctomycetota bacterium]